MTANVWNPGQGAIPVAQSAQTMLSQAFTAIAAQTLFNLTSYNYTPNTSSLLVAINGVMQIPGVDFTETSVSSFTTTSPLLAGDIVLALGFVGITATNASLTAIANTANGYASAANQSAINSASSASASSTSAGNSSTYAGNSATSAAAALASQNAAATSASNAATSATNTSNALASASAFDGMRNRLINGDFKIDQRVNAAGAAVPAGGAAYVGDRWAMYCTAAGRLTVSLASGAGISNINTYGLVTSVSASPPTGTDEAVLYQSIEANNLLDFRLGSPLAKTFTLSFWTFSNLPGLHSGAIRTGGATQRSIVFSFTINAANTWEYKTITIPGDTAAIANTWNSIGNGVGMTVLFNYGTYAGRLGATNAWVTGTFSGATGSIQVSATNGGNLYLSNVQLELGSAATAFQQRPYAQELALCQRYYCKTFNQNIIPANNPTGGNVGALFAASDATAKYVGAYWVFPVVMRAAPTAITYYNYTTGAGGTWHDANGGADSTPQVIATGDRGAMILINSGTPAATTNGAWYVHATALSEL